MPVLEIAAISPHNSVFLACPARQSRVQAGINIIQLERWSGASDASVPFR